MNQEGLWVLNINPSSFYDWVIIIPPKKNNKGSEHKIPIIYQNKNNTGSEQNLNIHDNSPNKIPQYAHLQIT